MLTPVPSAPKERRLEADWKGSRGQIKCANSSDGKVKGERGSANAVDKVFNVLYSVMMQ